MPRRRIRFTPTTEVAEGFDAIRREAGVELECPPEVVAEASRAAAASGRGGAGERLDLPFVTIDPPGSRDLDQALHIARRGDGWTVRYAIADVAAFVRPGGAVDLDAHVRGVTVYAPDAKAPLHPVVLSEGAASLLPGEWRPAVVWTLELDARGELARCSVVRRVVRSVEQHTYADIPAGLDGLLREVGERRLALERARGGVRLNVPEQEVVRDPSGGWTVDYRVPLPSEDWNAQISLLTGMAAATLMLGAGVGILRVQPPPSDKALLRLRRASVALGVGWPDALSYPEWVRGLDPAVPAQAALMHEAAGSGRGAGYVAFDGSLPAEHRHFAIAADYAHATAPLRRLQDRYVSECCLAACAGVEAPAWVRAGLASLPAAMAAGDHRAGLVERGVVDLVEAVLLAGHEGKTFDGVAIDERLVQLRSPAVRARLTAGDPRPGSEVQVRLDRADPATRTVEFSLAA